MSIVNTLDAPRAASARGDPRAEIIPRVGRERAEGATSARRVRLDVGVGVGARDGKQVEGIVPARTTRLSARHSQRLVHAES